MSAASSESATHAWGFGLATVAEDGTTLDTWYPEPALGEAPADAAAPAYLTALVGKDEVRRVGTEVVLRSVALDAAPVDASDVYLRLHLLSHRLVAPHGLSLDGQFGLLANVVWTSRGPCAVTGFEAVRGGLKATGPVEVYGVDKFPRMTDYVL
ncbi:MAG: 2,3,4,5-tetrahydropyridine-2,6-dicarboxylate N-succinyltransferase, partial [Microbacterium sp.]